MISPLTVKIGADLAGLRQELAKASAMFGSFEKQIAAVSASIANMFGAAAIYQGAKKTITILADFEHTMSEVKAITGAVGAEFEALEKDALRLGASTKFTASQVGQLQVAFGRLGFTTSEILSATEATLDLAAATGEDLAKSADVAGSTVRGFQLNASETQRVVDVMAASFNKTALGLDNFTESMKYVAPVAAAAGATMEETTAMLGTLADAGLRGSMAGTSLRKIFTDMTKDGRPLSARLEELAKKGITLQDSMDEVGRTAQTALLILSKNTDKTKELTSAFQNVTGEASKMARVMSDDLTGDFTKFTSALEGMITKLGNTEWIRKLTKDLTGIANGISGTRDLSDELETLAKRFSDSNLANNPTVLANFVKSISEARREAGKPIDLSIISELSEKYKLTEEQAQKFSLAVNEINKAVSFQEKAMSQFNEFAKRNGYTDLSKAVEDYKNRLYQLIITEQVRVGKTDRFKQFHRDQIAAYRQVIDILNKYKATLEKPAALPTGDVDKVVENLELLKLQLSGLQKEYEKAALTDSIRRQNLATEIRLLGERVRAEQKLAKFLAEQFVVRDAYSKGDFLKNIGLGFDAVNAKIKAAGMSIQSTFKGLAKAVEVDFTPVIHSALSGLGQALGTAISGSQNLGDALLGVLGNVLVQLGEMILAAGLGVEAFKESLKSLQGAPGIIAGIGLIALGSAISSSIKGLGSSAGKSPGASFNSSPAGIGSTRMNINGSTGDSKPVFVGVLKGQDMYIMLENYKRNNVFTKG